MCKQYITVRINSAHWKNKMKKENANKKERQFQLLPPCSRVLIDLQVAAKYFHSHQYIPFYLEKIRKSIIKNAKEKTR